MPALVSGGLLRRPTSTAPTGTTKRLIGAEVARQAHAALGDVGGPGIEQVGPGLKVARVLARLAVDEARPGGADDVACSRLRRLAEQLLHGRGELVELGDPIDHDAGLLARERLEIGQEVVRPGDVRLGLTIQAAMNRVIGSLE